MELHSTVLLSPSLTGEFILFANSLMIALVLLALTLKAARIPGNPAANIFFSLCSVAWSAGALARVSLVASGFPREHEFWQVAQGLQLSGAAALPIPILWTWRHYSTTPIQQKVGRWIEVLAIISAMAILGLLVARPGIDIRALTLHNASVLLIAGAAIMLRPASTPRSVLIPSLSLAAAAGGSSLFALLAPGRMAFGLRFISSHLVIVGAICSFVLFARFRYADVFVKYALRIILAGTFTSILGLMIVGGGVGPPILHGPVPRVLHLFQVVIVANFLLLIFTLIDDVLGRALNRWLFQTTDYQAVARELGHRMESIQSDAEIGRELERTAVEAMNLKQASFVNLNPPAMDWPDALLAGDIVEIEPRATVEYLAPVQSGGTITHVLLISPGSERPSFVLQDLNFLARITQLAGNRLESLSRQRELLDRQSRESALQKQIAEAELIALRAQIQPHFLFNSLNTIANLIVVDPAIAETMTLRLSSVFRHVLTNASRPLTTIGEEIEFIRSYLSIEEIRFSDRLKVVITLPEILEHEPIPSLILQPLVENALKHGLARKPGPANLWISVESTADQIRIILEDDGLGPDSSPDESSSGLGMKNVSQRLATHYQDSAGIRLESRIGGGSRVTLWLPREPS